MNEDVAKILNLELGALLAAGRPLDPRAWMTLVCVAYLNTFCEKEKIIWELVVTKAEKWLISSFPNVGESELQKAVHFLTNKVGKFCSLGHKLRPVSEAARGGQMWHCDMAASCVGGHAGDGLHSEVSVWRCEQDWRMTGGRCDFDMCGDCVRE